MQQTDSRQWLRQAEQDIWQAPEPDEVYWPWYWQYSDLIMTAAQTVAYLALIALAAVLALMC